MTSGRRPVAGDAFSGFRWFVAADLISGVGSQMRLCALAWHVYDLSASPVVLATVALARVLPIIVLAPVAGVLADTHRRRAAFVGGQLASAVLAIVLALVAWFGVRSPALLVAIALALGVVNAFSLPARAALVPSLVPPDRLAQALTVQTVLYHLAIVGGSVLGGAIVDRWGPAVAYGLDAATFVPVALVSATVVPSGGAARGGSLGGGLREALTHFARGRMLAGMLVIDWAVMVLSGAMNLLPVFARDVYGGGATWLGIFRSAPSAGALIAGIALLRGAHLRYPGRWFLAATAVHACAVAVLGLDVGSTSFAVALVVAGGGEMIGAIVRQAQRQVETPDALRGRVNALSSSVALSGPLLGELAAAAATPHLGVRNVALGGGVAAFAVVVVGVWALPSLARHARLVPARDAAALTPPGGT